MMFSLQKWEIDKKKTLGQSFDIHKVTYVYC